MASKQTAVAAPAQTGIQLSQDAPDWAKGGSGRGSENVGAKDMVLPRLEIVQAQSPIKDTNPDALEGLLFHSVTNEVIGSSAIIVPIYYRMEYLIWKDQDSGGGFFGAHDTMEDAQRRLQEEVSNGENPDELEIVDTPVHYCLRIKDDMTVEQLVISMAKSKAKVSRKWNAQIQIVGGDRFARAYKVTTFKDKNKANKTFFNYIVQPAGFPPESIYREAERLYEVFRTQGVKADHESGRSNDKATEAGGPAGGDNI